MKVKNLKSTPYNPRTITDAKLKQLKKSLDEFGDLSIIGFNRRTGNLFGGNQRSKNFDKNSVVKITKAFEKPTRAGTVAVGYILHNGERFAYREVDWDLTREKAANVAANKNAGEWDLPQLGNLLKELSSFDVDFDMDLTMFDEIELAQFGTTTVSEHNRSLIGEGENEDLPDEEPPEEPEKLLGPIQLFNGDCLETLKRFSPNSVDSLVTDPPAGIAFMGKEWDEDKGGRDGWVEWLTSVMTECYRVLKPGAHGLVWAIPRTSHWTATALENAGFEIRDVVTHLFGSGFPKSLDISKAIDKAAGAEREVLSSKRMPDIRGSSVNGEYLPLAKGKPSMEYHVTAPATDAAKQWEGWGTALKPASEHWVLIRKPLSEKTVAKNVLKWGTGGLNIDGGRIGNAGGTRKIPSDEKCSTEHTVGGYLSKNSGELVPGMGRFPANLVLDETAAEMLDEQTGESQSRIGKPRSSATPGDGWGLTKTGTEYADRGGASRFFYVAKASKTERNTHCRDLEDKKVHRFGAGIGEGLDPDAPSSDKNFHPTVKPVSLMRYLSRLITPANGIVLDCFMGSGTTGVAALREEFRFIGIERELEYFRICKKRLNFKKNQTDLIGVKTMTRKKRVTARV